MNTANCDLLLSELKPQKGSVTLAVSFASMPADYQSDVHSKNASLKALSAEIREELGRLLLPDSVMTSAFRLKSLDRIA